MIQAIFEFLFYSPSLNYEAGEGILLRAICVQGVARVPLPHACTNVDDSRNSFPSHLCMQVRVHPKDCDRSDANEKLVNGSVIGVTLLC